jgi:hypothetical protein
VPYECIDTLYCVHKIFFFTSNTASGYNFRGHFCIRNEWFKQISMVYLRHSNESALAPVLRLVILVAFTFCGLQNVNVNRVNFSQSSLSDRQHDSRFAAIGGTSTFGKVELRFSERGEVQRQSAPAFDSRNRWAASRTPPKRCMDGERHMKRFQFCIRNEWFTLKSMVFLRHSNESALAPVLRLVILVAFTFCGLQNLNVNRVN